VSGSGGGGYFSYSTATFSNNVVAHNSSGLYSYGATPTLNSNCVHNPSGTNYSGLSAGAGDISVDPAWRDAARNDYHLAVGSPCIDAGLDATLRPDWADADGRFRLSGRHVDIGCYEMAIVAGDLDRDGDVDGDDAALFESCASGPGIPQSPACGEMDIDQDHDGDVDQADFGIFQRCFRGPNVPADPNCAN
jgi:hypothetical protein